MNLEFIAERYSVKDLLDYSEKSRFELCDQDVINSLFQDDILLIDPKWNTANYEDDSLPAWCVRFAPRHRVEAFKKATKDPYILHFASTIKPWNEPGYKNAELFWSTMRETPFYELLLHRRIVENASYFAGTVSQRLDYMQSTQKQHKHHQPKPKKEKFSRRMLDKFCPKGTRRRERLKKFVCFITRKPYVKPYYPVA
jgi:lipopolysaccharide biosynthesis glycosyltransferase